MNREERLTLEASAIAILFLGRAVTGTYTTVMSETVSEGTLVGIFPVLVLSIGFAYVARGILRRNAWGLIGGMITSAGLLASDVLFTIAGYPQGPAEFVVDIIVFFYLVYRKEEFKKTLS